jgi:hypothetical protein
MPVDPKKRQKQQERRAAKRKAKQQLVTKRTPTGLVQQLTEAARYPVHDSWVTKVLWTRGVGSVTLSRELPHGGVAFAMFLIDRFCMGVKNVIVDIRSRFDYESDIVSTARREFGIESVSPAAARKIVESAVAYAAALGIAPHEDYHKAKELFGTIDASECAEEFEFGNDGKPYFIAGPFDTAHRCRQILNRLVEKCGVDGFHYLIPFATPEFVPEALAGRLGAGTMRAFGESDGVLHFTNRH